METMQHEQTYEDDYDDNLKKFVQMLKRVTHTMEIQIYTSDLVQIYREPSLILPK